MRAVIATTLALLATAAPAAAAPRADAADPAVISTGHVDLGPHFVNGNWTVALRDDTVQPAVWRDLDDVVLQANDKAKIAVPADRAYSFLGKPGEQLWVIPQVQQPGVIWPGWNTQDPEVEAQVVREVTWSLDAVDGPGAFTLFLNSDFGRPTPVFDSRTPYPQQTGIDVGTHVHGNWTFTHPGTYRLKITMTAHLENNTTVKDQQTLTLQAGETSTPTPAGERSEAVQPRAGERSEPIPATTPSSPTSAEAASTTGNLPGAIAAGGTLVLLLVLVYFVRRRRTTK